MGCKEGVELHLVSCSDHPSLASEGRLCFLRRLQGL